MKFLIPLLGIGLLLGGCLKTTAHDGPRPGYMSASAYAGPGQFNSRPRGAPNCGPSGTFSTQHGKCIGNKMHDIPLTESQKATFSTCEKIKTRTVMKGDK